MYRVLIVEDEYLLSKELTHNEIWKEFQMEVIGEVDNGVDVYDKVKETKPDLIFMDICMPGKDGLSVIKELQNSFDIEYIIMSGYSEFEYARQAVKLDVIDYILKPIEDKMLKESLEKAHKRLVSKEKIETQLSKDVPQINNKYLEDAIKYIEDHYHKELTVKSVADELGISESYMSKLFVKSLGVRFTEYINQLRIKKSIHIIKQNKYKIYEISEMVGYKEYRYFCIVFKKITGVTPLEYRNSEGAMK